MVQEERLDLNDIQGAIIPGFKKDHSVVVALRIEDVAGCKAWLKEQAKFVSSGAEVLAFNRLFKEVRGRSGTEEETPKALWTSLSFSAAALSLLRTPEEVERAFEDAFVDGMYQSALADPPSVTWVIGGGAAAVPHVLVVIAADDPSDLAGAVDRLVASIPLGATSGTPALSLVGRPQVGATLPAAMRGHEHFGFKDGISQPAVRGLASDAPDDYVDPRELAASDESFDTFAEPGRVLVWPGQFVIGYNRQRADDLIEPAGPMEPRAAWQRNGSYLVYRRLQQKVHLFWQFCRDGAERLSATAGREVSPVAFASMLVGRWPSGAPLVRASAADNPELAADDDSNNNFMFCAPPADVTLVDGTKPGPDFAPATADPRGRICPFVAHIRKVNPRDDPTDTSGARATPVRLMLRRGIPYGPVVNPETIFEDDGVDRGLLFMSYQTSIREQFEFVTKTWVNRRDSPHDSAPPAGHDPLIGQSIRSRFVRLPHDADPLQDVQLALPDEAWVVMTGGGYFFTPSISALSEALAQ